MNDYILITPVKNEEEFLPLLAESILNQTILPRVWVIVNSNSTDGSVKIIKDLCNGYDWIYFKNQENLSNERNHLNFSYAVFEGYEYAKEICQNEKISYHYVGKIDADIIIKKNFFGKLIEKFESDPMLGIASGSFYTLVSDGSIDYSRIESEKLIKSIYLPDELPDERLYAKKYLDKVGGFPISKYSPDTILLAKFRLKKWKIKRFDDVCIYSLRPTTGIERDLWKSSKSLGMNRYYLDYNPVIVFFNALFLLSKKPHYNAFAYLIGYLSSYIKRDSKLNDSDVRHYFRNVRIRELMRMMFQKHMKL